MEVVDEPDHENCCEWLALLTLALLFAYLHSQLVGRIIPNIFSS